MKIDIDENYRIEFKKRHFKLIRIGDNKILSSHSKIRTILDVYRIMEEEKIYEHVALNMTISDRLDGNKVENYVNEEVNRIDRNVEKALDKFYDNQK